MSNFIKIDDKIINVDKIDFIETVYDIRGYEYTRILFQERYINIDLTLNEVYKLIEDASKN